MQVFDKLRKTEYESTVALGFFDGVHKGHQEVVRKCVELSGDTRATVLTFKDSPSSVLSENKKPLITLCEQKLEKLSDLSVQEVFCVDFNEIKDLSAYQFVSEILHGMLNAKCVVTGFNYHFGKGGKAGVDELARLCGEFGIKCVQCEGVEYDGSVISSTRIRECISDGDIESANAMLGYSFEINGEIVSGNHIGVKIDSPTINQELNVGIVVPKFGVYATRVEIDSEEYIGATNIGIHPTVGKGPQLCETHLLNFKDGDLYGKSAKIRLCKFIRKEHKFATLDELKHQIEKDKEQINAYFKA